MTNTYSPDLEIDVLGLKCPLPVLKLKKRIELHASGTVVKLITSDETTLTDVPAYCELAGHNLLKIEHDVDSHVFWICLGDKSH